MQVVFVSNYINHHQLPLSDALYERLSDDYIFLQTEEMAAERVNMGWDPDAALRPYVRKYYEDKEGCSRLLLEADCVIMGGAEDEEIIIPRLEQGLFTIRYSERIYREGRWKFVSPRGLKKKYHDHIRFRKSPVYLLCAGAYVAGDFRLIHAYPGKKMKFGYFPEFIVYDDLDELRRNNVRVEILWVARFISLKQPEMMIMLAADLLKKNFDFHITMIGDGPLLEPMKKDVENKGLSEYISFDGSKKPQEVREAMRKADIFVFTSTHLEGWGAVLNESMNSGCFVLAPKQVGAAPYLISDGENGLIFNCRSDVELSKKVADAIKDEKKRKWLAHNAYETIKNTWNAKVAADRLLKFMEDPEHKIPPYEDGPMSKEK